MSPRSTHPTTAMLRALPASVAAVVLLFAPGPAVAQDDGHGPDAWQVVDVAADDVLNVRMGPDTRYPVIGAFAHDATGLQQVTCVPFMTLEQSMNLTEAERDALADLPRWCLMQDSSGEVRGWVAARYLAENGSTPVQAHTAPDDMVAAATSLVSRLYEMHELAVRGAGPDPLQPPLSLEFFFRDVAYSVSGATTGADPLYGAQDFDISDMQVTPDADRPMLRGMITIHARFRNFGTPQTVTFSLRADTGQEGAPVRIFSIQHDGWSVP